MRRHARERRLGALLGAGLAAFLCTAAALAGFNSLTQATHSVSTKRIFSGARTTSLYDFQDVAGGGGGTNADDELSYADSLTRLTGNWSSSFSSTRYVEFDLNALQPAGLALTAATFDFRYIPSTSTDTACYYFEVRKASDGSVLATYGSTGTPIACVTGSTYSTNSTAIPIVDTTGESNDLRVRVFVKNSGSRAIRMDMARVTATAYTAFTLYPKIYRNASAGGAPTVLTWELETAADAAQYTTASNWSSSFSSSRYLQFTFPAYLTTGSTITAATFTYSYRSNTSGDTTCWYFEVYSGAVLIGTHGSTASPVSCNATTSFVTDAVATTEVDTAAEANSLVVKVYSKVTGSRRSQTDLATVTLTYYLD